MGRGGLNVDNVEDFFNALAAAARPDPSLDDEPESEPEPEPELEGPIDPLLSVAEWRALRDNVIKAAEAFTSADLYSAAETLALGRAVHALRVFRRRNGWG